MGYRNYLYKVKKKDINSFRNMSLDKLKNKYGDKEDDNWVHLPELLGRDCIFEFGKLYWDDTIARIEATGEELFFNEEVQEYFCDYVPYLVGKDALKVAIDIYENKIKEMYKELNKEVEEAETFEDKYELYKRHIESYECWWQRLKVIDLEKDAICHSWLYEHLIFELVHLYKTIDFDEYNLVFLGW